jgi:uncharacterized membrane protein
MALQGIIYGLISALFNSLTYVLMRTYMRRPAASPAGLFAIMHTWMGIASLILVPFLLAKNTPAFGHWVGPLAWADGFYVAGQVLFFLAVRRAEASRISPLLGLKVLVLALVTVLALRQPLSAVQWLAVGLSLAAAVGLNYTGGRLPHAAAGAMLGAVFLYSMSDLGVARMANVFSPDRSLRGFLLSGCVAYAFCLPVAGVFAVAMKREERRREYWIAGLPIAATWLLGGISLFACFGRIGPLFGNIVQSMRGPFSVLMGLLVASLGLVHLEQKLTRSVFLRRLASAVLMCLAIALFYLGKRAGG